MKKTPHFFALPMLVVPMFAVFSLQMLSVGGMLTGCQTSEEKVQNAKENVKDATKDLKNVQKAVSDAEAEKAANAEAWRVFKGEAEAKIKSNEQMINELGIKIRSSGKKAQGSLKKSIDELKQKNNDMVVRINTFEQNQREWESFKREYNHDMDELGRALKDFAVNNKQ